MIAACRACGAGSPDPLPFAPGWARCRACGSDTSDSDPAREAERYQTPEYVRWNVIDCGGFDAVVRSVGENVRWFAAHRGPGRDFLDVGHNEGAMLAAMQADGWGVHGFDVNPHAYLGPHTTIAPAFAAGLFPRRYHAVNCREVLEHVPDWRGLLAELWAATEPGGLCQVQTPRPCGAFDPGVYQPAHLVIFAPAFLSDYLLSAGWAVLGRRLWPTGQCHLLRRPG